MASPLSGVETKFGSLLGWDESKVSEEPEKEESSLGLVAKSSFPCVRLKISSVIATGTIKC